MNTEKHLTAKGRRTATRVLDAATTVLAHDGFGGATLSRIAEEAGLVEAMWSGITSAPELARAYFALIGGGAGSPEVEEALRTLKRAYEQLITRQLQSISHTRWRLRHDVPSMVTLTLAVFRGLLLEWTETGDTAASAASLRRLKRVIAAEYVEAE